MPEYIEIKVNPDFLKIPVKGMLSEVEIDPLKLTEDLLKQLLPNYQDAIDKVKIYIIDPNMKKKAVVKNESAQISEAAKISGINLSEVESQAVYAYVCIKYVMQQLWFSNLKQKLPGSTILITLTRNGEDLTLQYTQKEKKVGKYSIPLQSVYKVKSSVLIKTDGTFPTTDSNTETMFIRDKLLSKYLKPALQAYLERRVLDDRDLYVIVPLLIDETVRKLFNSFLELKGVTPLFRENTAMMIENHFADAELRKEILDELSNITPAANAALPSATAEQVSLEHTTQVPSIDSTSTTSLVGTDADDTHQGPPLLSSLQKSPTNKSAVEDEKKADKADPASVNDEILGLISAQVEMKVTETDEQVLAEASKQQTVLPPSRPTGFPSVTPESSNTDVSDKELTSPFTVRFLGTETEIKDTSGQVMTKDETGTQTISSMTIPDAPPSPALSANVVPLFTAQDIERGDDYPVNEEGEEEETKPIVEAQKLQDYSRLSPPSSMTTAAPEVTTSITSEEDLIAHLHELNSSADPTTGLPPMHRATTPLSTSSATALGDEEQEKEEEEEEEQEIKPPHSSPRTTSFNLTVDSSVASRSSATDATTEPAPNSPSFSGYSGEGGADDDLLTALQQSKAGGEVDLHTLEANDPASADQRRSATTLTTGTFSASPATFQLQATDVDKQEEEEEEEEEEEDEEVDSDEDADTATLVDTSQASLLEASALVSGLKSHPSSPASGTGPHAKELEKQKIISPPSSPTSADLQANSTVLSITISPHDESKTDNQTRTAQQLQLKTDETGMTRIEIFDMHTSNLQTIIGEGKLDVSMLASCKKLHFALTKSLTAEQINQSLELLIEVISRANIVALDPSNAVNLAEAQKLIAPLNHAKLPSVAMALTRFIAGAALIVVASAVALASFSSGIVGMIGLEVGTGLLTKALSIGGCLIGAGLVWSGIGIFDKRPAQPIQPVFSAAEEINQNAERRLQSVSVR